MGTNLVAAHCSSTESSSPILEAKISGKRHFVVHSVNFLPPAIVFVFHRRENNLKIFEKGLRTPWWNAKKKKKKKKNWRRRSLRSSHHLTKKFCNYCLSNGQSGASLVAQWLRIRLQKTRVQALVQEDPTCCGATKPVCHNYWSPRA